MTPDLPAHHLRRMRLRAEADRTVTFWVRFCWGPWRKIRPETYMRFMFEIRTKGTEGVALATRRPEGT